MWPRLPRRPVRRADVHSAEHGIEPGAVSDQLGVHVVGSNGVGGEELEQVKDCLVAKVEATVRTDGW